ncbi:MAG: hypothetical protein DCC88_00545 [Spirobacillus cienkowskii]|jgi:polar amino acid transport system substrate-binding protein|uniref:Solute-binding protein family 3/N-terminal domain-containing protein n=1 Tax=Spirobacillus cienkowskii TaxID=495820 RepID=A0A369KX76_9BACT|nr:MAG: hypothetical protein DCC88_00545 [Spirobacillus cienkowskii]
MINKLPKISLLLTLLFYTANVHPIEKLKLVTGNDFAPFSDEKLKDGGMFTAIVKSLLKKINIPFELEFLPWARCYELVKIQKYDASFPYAYTDERATEVKYSKVYLYNSKIYVYTNKNYKDNKNLIDFKGGTYCSSVGYYIENDIQEMINKKELNKISKFDLRSCVESVIKNESSFFVANEVQFKEYRKQNISNFKNLVKVLKPINEIKLYIIYKKDFNDELLKKIDNASREFIKTSEYKKIIDSY